MPLNESRLTGPLLPVAATTWKTVCAPSTRSRRRCIDKIEPARARHRRAVSAGRRYCPPSLVDELERRVIDAVGRVYGDPRVCRDVGGRLALDPGEVSRAFPPARSGRL